MMNFPLAGKIFIGEGARGETKKGNGEAVK